MYNVIEKFVCHKKDRNVQNAVFVFFVVENVVSCQKKSKWHSWHPSVIKSKSLLISIHYVD